eukprot:134045-Chlamydomonas_euryale.AAC.1
MKDDAGVDGAYSLPFQLNASKAHGSSNAAYIFWNIFCGPSACSRLFSDEVKDGEVVVAADEGDVLMRELAVRECLAVERRLLARTRHTVVVDQRVGAVHSKRGRC